MLMNLMFLIVKKYFLIKKMFIEEALNSYTLLKLITKIKDDITIKKIKTR